MSKVIREYNQHTIKTAVAMLDNSAIIAIPTETVYGLVGKYSDQEAINKIYKLKNRDENKPLAILVASLEQAQKYGIFSETAKKIAQAFWPGPLTIIVPSIEDSWIGIRIAKNNFINDVINMLDQPLVATSLNLSNMPSAVIYEDIDESFLKELAAVFDIYDTKPSGIASTIIKVERESFQVIREGFIKGIQIKQLLDHYSKLS